jgi:carboxypeptidase Taq
LSHGTEMPDSYRRLLEITAEVHDLERISQLLGWDQQVYMPPGGVTARGEQQSLLAKLAHERSTSDEVGRILEELSGIIDSLPYDSDEAANIRVARWQYDQRAKLPTSLVEELSRAQALGYTKWVEARQADDFLVFRPALETLLDISRRVAAALGYGENPMDAFIDMSEPGLTTAACDALFAELKVALVPLIRSISAVSPRNEDEIIKQAFAVDRQIALGTRAVEKIGYDDKENGRVDLTVHPFTTRFGLKDVRITTRVSERDFSYCFFSMLHEAGHGIYDQGLPERLDRQPAGITSSSGLHESQSRLWENLVGRSLQFWKYFMPVAQEFFPAQLGNVTPEEMYRAVNRVRPSFIRTQADEVTYNLHIMLRFELEKELLLGRLAVKDLREAWNARMQEYLGIIPETDVAGVLQDVHWSMGVGGGFQGYTLGNVIGVQLFDAAERECGGIKDGFVAGDFARLFNWMRRNLHQHAAKYTPQEMVKKATGDPISAGPYLSYIKEKYSALYGL